MPGALAGGPAPCPPGPGPLPGADAPWAITAPAALTMQPNKIQRETAVITISEVEG